MNNYETSARVEDPGQIHVTGVPFPLGTEVSVVIAAKGDRQPEQSTAQTNRATALFEALDKARNEKPVGRLNRAELYDRNCLH